MSILSLRTQKDFDFVNKHGFKIFGSHFIIVKSYKNLRVEALHLSSITLGMKVSRKFSKKAVIRNKVKRRIRHLVQLIVKDPHLVTNNISIIVIPRQGFENANFLELSNDFGRAFNKSPNLRPRTKERV